MFVSISTAKVEKTVPNVQIFCTQRYVYFIPLWVPCVVSLHRAGLPDRDFL